jgi:hypothetical protein
MRFWSIVPAFVATDVTVRVVKNAPHYNNGAGPGYLMNEWHLWRPLRPWSCFSASAGGAGFPSSWT